MANFDDLQGAVAQFGANNKVIFDDSLDYLFNQDRTDQNLKTDCN